MIKGYWKKGNKIVTFEKNRFTTTIIVRSNDSDSTVNYVIANENKKLIDHALASIS